MASFLPLNNKKIDLRYSTIHKGNKYIQMYKQLTK